MYFIHGSTVVHGVCPHTSIHAKATVYQLQKIKKNATLKRVHHTHLCSLRGNYLLVRLANNVSPIALSYTPNNLVLVTQN